jgi:hypothetical protein
MALDFQDVHQYDMNSNKAIMPLSTLDLHQLMLMLMQKLYSKFGNQINLDDD